METANSIKLALASALALLTSFLGDLAIPVAVLIGVVILDYITGVLKAAYNRKNNVIVANSNDSGLQSRVAFWGAVKKFSYFLCVVAALGIDWVLVRVGVDIPLLQRPLAMLVTFWFIVTDLISVCENIVQLGVPLPNILLKLLAAAKKSLGSQVNPDTEIDKKD